MMQHLSPAARRLPRVCLVLYALAAVSGLPVPPQLLSLRTAADRFTEVIDRDGIDRAVTDFMKSR